MSFWLTVFRQLGRNLRQTWASQFMTLLTVSLSVLIFTFFYLIYSNMLHFGNKLGDDLSLIVYLEDEPGPEMQKQLERKITQFDNVESIRFISRQQAYERFAAQLGDNRSVLDDIPEDFLPPSIEVVPLKTLRSLNQVKSFSRYLDELPGTIKVQYGQDWVERFYQFTRLLSIVVVLSGVLLILTTIFMVAYTIRLTILGRQDELKLLKLVGATNNYIRTPFLLEGLLQGLLGSTLGIFFLFLLYQWIRDHFSGPGFFTLFEFSFFPPMVTLIIVGVSILLCTLGSYSTMRRFLNV
jgi:cell division transport system permease protein